MILRTHVLEEIRAGRITLAFRRWRRPTVRSGGTLRTALGVLAIESVAPVDAEALSVEDAVGAGFASLSALRADLQSQRPGTLYRIRLRWAGADPRVALRENAALTPEDVSELRTRLQRLDATSAQGPWTLATLELIRDNEGVRAPDLAARRGLETAPFKRSVRKLKELGLTESLEVGYRLSPRGSALLEALIRDGTERGSEETRESP
jgi:hypothetical protein